MVCLVQYCPNMLWKHTFSISFMKREEGVKTQRPGEKLWWKLKISLRSLRLDLNI